MRWKNLAITALVIANLSGCSLANKMVYRIDINQGNYIEETAVEKLKFGMNKAQVKYLLGPPMLVESGFPNTWYYVQWLREGHQEPKQKNLTLNFDDQEKLILIKGDFKPDEAFYAGFE